MIIHYIMTARIRYMNKLNEEPNVIYLGYAEYEAFITELASMGIKGSEPLKYLGMEPLRVPKENFLSLGRI